MTSGGEGSRPSALCSPTHAFFFFSYILTFLHSCCCCCFAVHIHPVVPLWRALPAGLVWQGRGEGGGPDCHRFWVKVGQRALWTWARMGRRWLMGSDKVREGGNIRFGYGASWGSLFAKEWWSCAVGLILTMAQVWDWAHCGCQPLLHRAPKTERAAGKQIGNLTLGEGRFDV